MEMRRDADERDARLLARLRPARPSMTTVPPPPPPLSGTRFDAKAACTPGSASTRRTMSSTRRDLASPASYTVAGHVEPHRHQRLRVEAEVVRVEIGERAHEQQRADERDQRQRHLRDDQRAAQRAIAARCCRACLPSACRADCRARPAAPGTGRTRTAVPTATTDRVRQRPPVDVPRDVVRHLIGRHARTQSAACRPRRAARRAARSISAEHDALGEQLADDAAAAGAERGAHRELPAPARRPAPAAGWRRSSTR